jgi:hypothetical protein
LAEEIIVAVLPDWIFTGSELIISQEETEALVAEAVEQAASL